MCTAILIVKLSHIMLIYLILQVHSLSSRSFSNVGNNININNRIRFLKFKVFEQFPQIGHLRDTFRLIKKKQKVKSQHYYEPASMNKCITKNLTSFWNGSSKITFARTVIGATMILMILLHYMVIVQIALSNVTCITTSIRSNLNM